MQCLTDLGAGVYQVANPQPTEYTSCVYVLAQPEELTAQAWTLPVSGAQEIVAAIALLWGIGAVFRAVISQLRSKGSNHETD